MSRVVLKIPKEANFFVLFHGNLVHSGAAGKYEKNPNSMNIAADLRAFAYVHKYHLSRADLKKYNVKITSNHTEDAAIGTTYLGCPKMDYPSNRCASCENFICNNRKKMKYHSSNGFEIDIMEAYNEFKTLKKQS